MARVLIVGCGCRGRELARSLVADGHAVTGTTRDEAKLPLIEEAGADAALADPDRLATLLPRLESVSALCWLMGSAAGDAEAVAALHGPRLGTLLERLVDTAVRGFVYEAEGSVERGLLEQGAALARQGPSAYPLPVALIEADPGHHEAWLAAAREAVSRALGGAA